MEIYDAATPAPESTMADSLIRMQARDADQRMLALLEEVGDLVAEGRARDREDGIDPGIIGLLDAITGADDAPLEFRSMHRRVEEGALTWEQVWLFPEDEAGGPRLINTAMKAQGALLGDALRQFEADEPETAGS